MDSGSVAAPCHFAMHVLSGLRTLLIACAGRKTVVVTRLIPRRGYSGLSALRIDCTLLWPGRRMVPNHFDLELRPPAVLNAHAQATNG